MLNRNDIFMLNDTDLFKSWAIIDKLQPGEVYNLDNIPEKRRDLFRDCIKQRIDTLNDCEFNEDYTRLKKISTIADLQKSANNV
jgi:hypothetical protein